jgi:glucuronokinase
MRIIRKRAYARAGLLGNPSDGYGGRTISVIVRNFCAEVELYESDAVGIVLAEDDRASFRSVQELSRDVSLHGYYGGIRLIKATIKRFVDYCKARDIPLSDQNFSVRYSSDIPRQTGLAGSSAIIIALLRCLMEFYGLQIPIQAQPGFVLSVERDELGIAAGWQDRVIQVYEGLMFMDFDPALERNVDGIPSFHFERLPLATLPPLYLAYNQSLSEPTEVFHADIRKRFQQGEEAVATAMRHLAGLALEGRAALLRRDSEGFGRLMNENFDIRMGIYNLPAWQVGMVKVARSCGVTAKFAGSGGAIVGSYSSEDKFLELQRKLNEIGSHTLKLQTI